ncbi:G-type lectin S-receptor-like serine/threonine-protein kinase CES101 [Zea mays]|uniref:non-specific serine/threonine protein kinase n=1 Tax=Zea mays TaxID=4577 RepID=A0A1D6N9S5_MAIZE|nr:G-type lectin S-receptor-like serine/threonine-protein kinase CES101 [Zea mays]
MSRIFVLGFFSPGASSKRYVGIWHNDVSERRVVWVANRNDPLQDTSGILKFDNSSNLIVLDGRGNSFTVAYGRGVQDVEAAMLDNGNFILRSITNQAKIIWQSFDSPTDTWFPGINITLGAKLLTSWKSYDDPAVGDYSFGPGITNASQLIIWWKGIQFWTSLRWNGDTNSLIPELTSLGIIPVLFQCDNLTCTYTANPRDTMTKIVLDPNGSLNIAQFSPVTESWTLLWRQPPSCFEQQAGDTRKGCTRQIQLQCNGDRTDIRVEQGLFIFVLLIVQHEQRRRQALLRRKMYYEQRSQVTNSFSYSGHKLLWIAGVLPSIGFLIFCLILFIWISRSKNKGKGKQDGHHSIMTSDAIKLWEGEKTSTYFAVFSFSQIRNGTDKFSTENMLGEGGFGPVYKKHVVMCLWVYPYLVIAI